jgi:hypothetical protein
MYGKALVMSTRESLELEGIRKTAVLDVEGPDIRASMSVVETCGSCRGFEVRPIADIRYAANYETKTTRETKGLLMSFRFRNSRAVDIETVRISESGHRRKEVQA